MGQIEDFAKMIEKQEEYFAIVRNTNRLQKGKPTLGVYPLSFFIEDLNERKDIPLNNKLAFLSRCFTGIRKTFLHESEVEKRLCGRKGCPEGISALDWACNVPPRNVELFLKDKDYFRY